MTDEELNEKLKKAEQEATSRDTAESDSEIENLRDELEKMTEMAKRTMADFENFRRRQEEERKVWSNMANMSLIKILLPIADNFDRAKTNMPEQSADWAKGILMSIDQFHKALSDFGLMPMETLGQRFNPDHHEALLQGPGEKDVIIEELEKGYLLGDRVLRHAKVKVGNGE